MDIKKRAKIVAALVKAGYEKAVMEDWNREGDLAINCEVWCGDEVGMAGDYYREGGVYNFCGIKIEIEKILDKFKCYGEWYHAGAFVVVEN